MKVNELIERLKKFNPNADVSLSITGLICSEDIELGYITGDNSAETKKTTKMVFIEGVDSVE